MSAIASQMAGPNGLNIFEGTLEYPGVKIGRKNLNYFFSFSKFHGQRRSLQLVLLNKYVCMTPEIFENVDCIIVGIHREIFISDNSKQIIIKSNINRGGLQGGLGPRPRAPGGWSGAPPKEIHDMK